MSKCTECESEMDRFDAQENEACFECRGLGRGFKVRRLYRDSTDKDDEPDDEVVEALQKDIDTNG